MNAWCPVSSRQVNERTTQLNASWVVMLMLVYVFTPFKAVIWLLVLDFCLRGFVDARLSPLANASRLAGRLLRLRQKMVSADPKIFAARVGFLMTLTIAVLAVIGADSASLVLAWALIVFALLEAVFRFCLACRIYPLIYRQQGD